jgi:hypothetical protein
MEEHLVRQVNGPEVLCAKEEDDNAGSLKGQREPQLEPSRPHPCALCILGGVLPLFPAHDAM